MKNKQPCQPGEIYCVRCHRPRKPAGDMAELQPVTSTMGNLIGICPQCESMMYRRVNLARLEQVGATLDITITQALPRFIKEHITHRKQLLQTSPESHQNVIIFGQFQAKSLSQG